MTVVALEFGDQKPYAKQLPLLHHEETVVCEGATKTGKTMITMVWQLARFLEYPAGSKLPNGRKADGRQAWYGPTYRVAKISYERAVAQLQPAINAGLLSAIATPYPKIVGIGDLAGREWHFLSTEKVSLIYGEQWDSIVVEEFTRHRAKALDAIQTTAHPKRAPMRLIGNLVDKINDGYRLARQVESGEGLPGWMHLSLTCYDARDAGLVTADELEAKRADYAKRGMLHVFARDWENRFDDAGSPFPPDLLQRCTLDRPAKGAPAILLDAGGTENPAGIVVARLWHEGGQLHCHITSARHFIGLLTDLEQQVHALTRDIHPAAITLDSYAPMFVQSLTTRYPQAVKVSSRADTLTQNYQTIRAMMEGGTFTISPGCDVLLRDLDHVGLSDDGVNFGYYQWHFAETDREHSVHADTANALIQGFGAAAAKVLPSAGSGHVAVHSGAPLRTHDDRSRVTTRGAGNWR